MATTTVTGAGVKNNGGVWLNGGTPSNSLNTSYSLSSFATVSRVGSKVNEGSTYGTHKPLSGGVFGSMETGKYISSLVTDRVAQTDLDLRSMAADTPARNTLPLGRGYRRWHITSWSYTTGAATKGGSAGTLIAYVTPSNGSTTAVETRPTLAIPGELVYMYGSLSAALDDYKARQI